jgi:hypothetical protein
MMRAVYLWLSRLVALLVVVQAMAITWMTMGLVHWVDTGHTLNHAVLESWADKHPTWDGAFGFPLHAFIIGEGVLPLTAILLLLASFFAKVPKGVVVALVIVVLVGIQIMLGLSGEDHPKLGLLHGLNAFLIFGSAMGAAMMAKRPAATS